MPDMDDVAGVAPKGKRAWSFQKTLAEECSKFGEFIQDAFGSEVLYHKMKTDCASVAEFCSEWLALDNKTSSKAKSEDSEHDGDEDAKGAKDKDEADEGIMPEVVVCMEVPGGREDREAGGSRC